jgi:hypothetical protein
LKLRELKVKFLLTDEQFKKLNELCKLKVIANQRDVRVPAFFPRAHVVEAVEELPLDGPTDKVWVESKQYDHPKLYRKDRDSYISHFIDCGEDEEIRDLACRIYLREK